METVCMFKNNRASQMLFARCFSRKFKFITVPSFGYLKRNYKILAREFSLTLGMPVCCVPDWNLLGFRIVTSSCRIGIYNHWIFTPTEANDLGLSRIVAFKNLCYHSLLKELLERLKVDHLKPNCQLHYLKKATTLE